MNLNDLAQQRMERKAYWKELEELVPGCNNCLKYQARQCQKYQSAPPPAWVVGPVDCEHWDFDDIPF